jgi:hypothetical protein
MRCGGPLRGRALPAAGQAIRAAGPGWRQNWTAESGLWRGSTDRRVRGRLGFSQSLDGVFTDGQVGPMRQQGVSTGLPKQTGLSGAAGELRSCQVFDGIAIRAAQAYTSDGGRFGT